MLYRLEVVVWALALMASLQYDVDGFATPRPASDAMLRQLSVTPIFNSYAPLYSSSSSDDLPDNGKNEGIDVTLDERLYRVKLPRATGIEWGTDLSFSFVYVRDMDPSGPAYLSKVIEKRDQLCELKAPNDSPPINLLGASFDNVMTAFADLDKSVKEVDLVFFRGTKDELKAMCTGNEKSGDPETITITIIENKGTPQEKFRLLNAPAGCNIRQVCVDNGINVYQSVTRWTNCKGKQLCGTCIVNVSDGSTNTNRKSMDEESTLRENPESYRLSCVAFAYGDVTVETFPPINPAQWTR